MSAKPSHDPHPFNRQLIALIQRHEALFRALDQRSLLVTGATGFFGTWLISAILQAEQVLGIRCSIQVLTRDPSRLTQGLWGLVDTRQLKVHTGDIRSARDIRGQFSHIVHAAATSAAATFHRQEDPLTKFDTTLEGTRAVLDLARAHPSAKLLLVSSGAFYGPVGADECLLQEDHPAAPAVHDLDSAIGQAKRAAEFLCHAHAERHGLSFSVARCFSFVGPGLPLDLHYAIGNFIRDALAGQAIRVKGDGQAIRSYMHAGDLVIWLLTLLLSGANGRAYNVGSDQPISIRELAHKVANVLKPGISVEVCSANTTPTIRSCYVPCIERARQELGLAVWTPLEQAIWITAVAAKHGNNFEM